MVFLACHSPCIVVMVKPCEMKNSMESQNFDLLSGGVPQTTRVSVRDFRRDGYVSREIVA